MTNKSLFFKTSFGLSQIKNKAVTIKMTPEQYCTIDFLAKKLDKSKSDVIRLALIDFINKNL